VKRDEPPVNRCILHVQKEKIAGLKVEKTHVKNSNVDKGQRSKRVNNLWKRFSRRLFPLTQLFPTLADVEC